MTDKEAFMAVRLKARNAMGPAKLAEPSKRKKRGGPEGTPVVAYHHEAPSDLAAAEVDREMGAYYVTVLDRADNARRGRWGFLLGPFKRHARAQAWVTPAGRRRASGTPGPRSTRSGRAG